LFRLFAQQCSLNQSLLTASAILIRLDVISVPRRMNRRIEHFQKPRHQPLAASDHVQAALSLMFLQGFL
jgi:hypothetical protein